MVSQIERLHTVAAVASAIGRHPISLYKSIGGLSNMPIPKYVRMGTAIRFRDSDVRAFLEGLTSESSSSASCHNTLPHVLTASPKRARGRPRKIKGAKSGQVLPASDTHN